MTGGHHPHLLHQSFAVPLITRDVQDEEVFKDLVWALQQLDQTVEVVFRNIQTRVTAEKKRVTDLGTRVASCRRMIGSVQGSTKAITVSGRCDLRLRI